MLYISGCNPVSNIKKESRMKTTYFPSHFHTALQIFSRRLFNIFFSIRDTWTWEIPRVTPTCV